MTRLAPVALLVVLAGPLAGEAQESAIWREPADIHTRDLYLGPGGKDGRPKGRLSYLKEDLDGTKAKILAVDEHGTRWKIKLGSEAQPEVAATRLVWAAGYFADENYYERELRIDNLPRLERGGKHVSTGGIVHDARVERDDGKKKVGTWDWADNPYAGTRALNGLRALMVLVNNWDLGSENNAIRHRQGVARAYYVGDLGSSFGRADGRLVPTRNDVTGYEHSTFIRDAAGDIVDFPLRTCSPIAFVAWPPFYLECTRLKKVARGIPRADARWIGTILAGLSPGQIADAFRAAGYGPDHIDRYARAVAARIARLCDL